MANLSTDILVSRRHFLISGAAASGILIGRAGAETPSRKRMLRVAHLTDFHIQPESRAPQGVAACLQHINSLPDRPDLILSGGDHIMDSFRRPRERTAMQWKVWSDVTRIENSIPVHACLGNHDIWGWDRSKSGTTGDEPEYGKRWACDVLGLQQPYYSFDQGGWHFIALDGIQPSTEPGKFSAFLDEAQFAWLESDLESVPRGTPILIWTHIPIISAVVNHLATRESIHSDSIVEGGHVHADSIRLTSLFAGYPNVKVCLAGHLHRIDRVEFRGIQYYCNGAVCGRWWKGANEGFAEGYSLVDLYSDGTHATQYVTYGWQAESDKKPG